MSQIKVSSVQNLSGTTVLDVSGGTANLAALTAGSTVKAPITFTGGNILTTPADGSIEYQASNKQFFGPRFPPIWASGSATHHRTILELYVYREKI